jgi:hypothetical protein
VIANGFLSAYRFLLALWYFHSSGMGSSPWLSCNPAGPGQNGTCTFKEFGRDQDKIMYLDVPKSVKWLSSQNEYEWQGVICGSGPFVVGISIGAWTSCGMQALLFNNECSFTSVFAGPFSAT